MPSKSKRLRIMAGPNGSGKTTILREVSKHFYCGPYVNADDIEKSLREQKKVNLLSMYDLRPEDGLFTEFLNQSGKSWMEKAKKENSKVSIRFNNGVLTVQGNPSPYDAALAADFIRHQLLLKGETFTFETVLSHPSKVDFLQKSNSFGFKNYLYFICTVDPVINISRVQQRVKLGGHPVPEDRIIKRYKESLKVLPYIIPLCHRVFLFDNSAEERSIEPVAKIDSHKNLEILTSQVPRWVDEFVIRKLYKK